MAHLTKQERLALIRSTMTERAEKGFNTGDSEIDAWKAAELVDAEYDLRRPKSYQPTIDDVTSHNRQLVGRREVKASVTLKSGRFDKSGRPIMRRETYTSPMKNVRTKSARCMFAQSSRKTVATGNNGSYTLNFSVPVPKWEKWLLDKRTLEQGLAELAEYNRRHPLQVTGPYEVMQPSGRTLRIGFGRQPHTATAFQYEQNDKPEPITPKYRIEWRIRPRKHGGGLVQVLKPIPQYKTPVSRFAQPGIDFPPASDSRAIASESARAGLKYDSGLYGSLDSRQSGRWITPNPTAAYADRPTLRGISGMIGMKRPKWFQVTPPPLRTAAAASA